MAKTEFLKRSPKGFGTLSAIFSSLVKSSICWVCKNFMPTFSCTYGWDYYFKFIQEMSPFCFCCHQSIRNTWMSGRRKIKDAKIARRQGGVQSGSCTQKFCILLTIFKSRVSIFRTPHLLIKNFKYDGAIFQIFNFYDGRLTLKKLICDGISIEFLPYGWIK